MRISARIQRKFSIILLNKTNKATKRIKRKNNTNKNKKYYTNHNESSNSTSAFGSYIPYSTCSRQIHCQWGIEFGRSIMEKCTYMYFYLKVLKC